MWENKLDSKYGIYYSRWIASWIKEGGTVSRGGLWLMKDWLRSLDLNEEDIKAITFLADNGKLELENSASDFLETHKNDYKKD